jgi:hypothetical protein
MTIQHARSWKVLSLILICFIGACAVFKEERTYSKNGLTITLRSLNYLDDVQGIKFKYPVIVSEKTMRNHLLSLWHNNIVSPGKPKPVFSFDEATELAPLFKTVLKKVTPGKYIHFKFQSPGGLAEGQVFATADKIHWRFLRINGKDYSNDPLRIRTPTWKMVRMRGQAYRRIQKGGFKKALKNWIVADINLPFPKQRSQSPATVKPPPGNSPQSGTEKTRFKEKLDNLQKLYKEGLIDKGEYRRKKEELLDQYLKGS